MDESGIWTLVIIMSVVILIITFLTSVTVLHKKFVEKPLENMEDEKNKEKDDTKKSN